MTIRAVVVGAAGYSGAVLTAILLNHPQAELFALFGSPSHSSPAAPPPDSRPRTFADAYPRYAHIPGSDLPILPADADRIRALAPDVVFLATPHEASAHLAPALVPHTCVIDLSAAFRLADAALYPIHYGFSHAPAAESLLRSAVYAIPELVGDALRPASSPPPNLIASPGCYPTSAILALAPLVRAGAIRPESIAIIDSVSGVSGAGRAASLKTSFCEVSLRAYNVFSHRHTPEIETRSGLSIGRAVFTPHLGPFDRGILSTIHLELNADFSAARLQSVYDDAYADAPFVRLRAAGDWPAVGDVTFTNRCDIAFAVDEPRRRAVICSAIDNLVKGAAGQAVQSMNIRFGLDQRTGLEGTTP